MKSSHGNKNCFIGYSDGTLEIRSPVNLEITQTLKGLGVITNIVTDDKEFIIISNREGQLIYVPFDEKEEREILRRSHSNITSGPEIQILKLS